MMNTAYQNDLNKLLSSYQVHYQNLRLLHWNIKGENFFELHVKYEEWYTRAQVIIDELAERILTLGLTPASNFSSYLKDSAIEELPITNNGKSGVNYVLQAQNDILELEKNLLEKSDEINDEGTNAFMSDLIREKEKTNWMLKAWLNK